MTQSGKPSNLVYSVTERPPLWIAFLSSFQHLCVFAISFIFPVMIVRSIGGSTIEASFLVSMSMIAGGIGVMVQAFSRGPLGSGYLCPQVCGPSFLVASILAAKTGGLSLMLGMTFIAGLAEALFSRIMPYLRFLFPPEITGLIVALVGITVVRFAAMNFFGMGPESAAVHPVEVMLSLFILSLIIGLNVWSKGKLKLFCVLVGMLTGYILAYALGLIDTDQIALIAESPIFWFPLTHHPGWSFEFTLVIPFLIAMICSSLKSVGDLTTCQKINDTNWKRTDMNNIGKGILADSVGCMSAGVLGGMGQSTSSTNVGLSIATGITSRFVAYPMGLLLILLGFFPKLSLVFAIMPRPVMGAALIFALSFMIVAGFQIVMSRMIDARKTFIVGISLIFALTVDIMPELYDNIHSWIHVLFSSSLATGTLTAVFLNLLFQIGKTKKVHVMVKPEISSSALLVDFIEKNGAQWGARPEVIARAAAAVNEFLEAAVEHGLTDQDIKMEICFDEFNLDVHLLYQGEPMNFPCDPPDLKRVLDDRTEQFKFSCYLMERHTDKIKSVAKKGAVTLHLHFDH
ncbi:MAG: solute carrier family 23 protein [Desulfonatronovibrio sp.]